MHENDSGGRSQSCGGESDGTHVTERRENLVKWSKVASAVFAFDANKAANISDA